MGRGTTALEVTMTKKKIPTQPDATCSACGASAQLTDCGHLAQPRPIAAGRADGSDGQHDYCSYCADA